MQRQRGLTLLELLVVLAIIGIAMVGVSLSMRDSSQTQVEREAQRLVAVLEATRVQSRTSGIALIWQPTPEGFVIRSTLAPNTSLGNNATQPPTARTEAWLTAGTQATINTTGTPTALPVNGVVLGPEPILAPTRITLKLTPPNSASPPAMLNIGTDGRQPFQVVP
jgi:general secretion pathway protein H